MCIYSIMKQKQVSKTRQRASIRKLISDALFMGFSSTLVDDYNNQLTELNKEITQEDEDKKRMGLLLCQ